RRALLQTTTVVDSVGPPPVTHQETGPEARKVMAFMAQFAPTPPGPLVSGSAAYNTWIADPANAVAITGAAAVPASPGPPPVAAVAAIPGWSAGHLSNTPPAAGAVPDTGGPANP